MKRMAIFAFGVISYGIFFLTFLYLIGFLGNLYVPRSIDVGPQATILSAAVINLGLILLFGLQHSVMARPGFKQWWTQFVPKPAERSIYVLATSAVLILTYWLWKPIDIIIWQAQADWAVYGLWTMFAMGFGLVLLSTFLIDHFELFGLKQAVLALVNKICLPPEFKVTLFYKFIRHPLYLGWFLAFWATPTMTAGHLLFAVGMSVYIFIAIPFEERDLVKYHGAEYQNYKSQVPML
ncbi:MAG: isoprenylcysteine carboxylmethyltransferase family protein, partial [Gammaproteobacteria bacterium]|nr:isoprenylcysteine carboxylmethyltransferase family protein [Gammaproteobacteria bacterium]